MFAPLGDADVSGQLDVMVKKENNVKRTPGYEGWASGFMSQPLKAIHINYPGRAPARFFAETLLVDCPATFGCGSVVVTCVFRSVRSCFRVERRSAIRADRSSGELNFSTAF